MDKDAVRKLSPAEQHERRRQVIRASYKRGMTETQIAQEIGLSHSRCFISGNGLARYEATAMAALAPRTRGGVLVKIGR